MLSKTPSITTRGIVVGVGIPLILVTLHIIQASFHLASLAVTLTPASQHLEDLAGPHHEHRHCKHATRHLARKNDTRHPRSNATTKQTNKHTHTPGDSPELLPPAHRAPVLAAAHSLLDRGLLLSHTRTL
eukprot:3590355-Rhodomonas_salina.2